MILKAIITAIAAPTAALALAGIASADTDSLVNVGDTNLGVTVGTTGGSASLAGTTVTVDGFPMSTTTIVGRNPVTGMTVYTYTATTDYNYEGGISHTSSLTSDPVSFNNEFEVTPMEGLDQRADVRLGMTVINCTQFVNCTVGGSG